MKTVLAMFVAASLFASAALAQMVLPTVSDYQSKTAEEVLLTFDGVSRSRLDNPPNIGDATWDVRRVLEYLPGPLAGGKFKAGSKDQDRFNITAMNPVSDGMYEVHFHYSGVYVIEKGHGPTVNVMLPVNFGSIYEASQVAGSTDRERNPCTNTYFPDLEHFWYFWNPLQDRCPLKINRDYNVFTATLTPLTVDTRVHYPDYPRLVDANGNLSLTIAFGANDDANGRLPPEKTKDYNSQNFISVAKRLQSLGFARYRWTAAQLSTYCPKATGSTQTIEEFVRMDGGRRVDVKMLWGTTSLHHESMPFYCLLNDAMTNSSAFVYNGHSGLGAAIFLQDLRQSTGFNFTVNKDRYQIFSYNGCSSYRYYNRDLFEEKKSPLDPDGTRNLEIINNGIEGSFGDLAKLTLGVVEPILSWSKSGVWTSYQTMMDTIATGHLTGVNGLNDNPTAPYR